ncbi:MAG: hypothetical protein KDB18_00145, partial [Salinibacterium sp.]|nr:hypothetical protein [Salinibacterium sp.]
PSPAPRASRHEEVHMTEERLAQLLFVAGIGQACVLIASALVPFQMDWKKELGGLSRLHRQMYWVYGGYVVLAILAFGILSLVCAEEIASRSWLARGLAAYIALFWGIRLVLQAVFDVREHLTTWWLKAGYRLLSALFLAFTLLFGWVLVG